RAGFVGEETDGAAAVVAVKRGVPGAGDRVHLVLADQVEAVAVGVIDYSAHDLFHHLRVSGQVTIVDQVTLDAAVDDLANLVAVTVVNQPDISAVGCGAGGQAVFAVVIVGTNDLLRS